MTYLVEIKEYSVDTDNSITSAQVKALASGEGYSNLRTYRFSGIDFARTVYIEACKRVQAIKNQGSSYDIIAVSLIEEDSDDEGIYQNLLEDRYPDINKEA